VHARASARDVSGSVLISIATKTEQFQELAAEKLVGNTVADFISPSIRVVNSISSISSKLRPPTRDCNGNTQRSFYIYMCKEDFRNENCDLTSLSRDCFIHFSVATRRIPPTERRSPSMIALEKAFELTFARDENFHSKILDAFSASRMTHSENRGKFPREDEQMVHASMIGRKGNKENGSGFGCEGASARSRFRRCKNFSLSEKNFSL